MSSRPAGKTRPRDYLDLPVVVAPLDLVSAGPPMPNITLVNVTGHVTTFCQKHALPQEHAECVGLITTFVLLVCFLCIVCGGVCCIVPFVPLVAAATVAGPAVTAGAIAVGGAAAAVAARTGAGVDRARQRPSQGAGGAGLERV